jgi:hypothetical protein
MFCPKCNYLLDITKNAIKTDIEQKPMNINQFLNIVMDETAVNDIIDIIYKLDFSLNDLTNHNKFKKLDEDTKNFVINQYESVNQSKSKYIANFICNNCGFFKEIKPGTELYNKSYILTNKTSLENPHLKAHDPTLIRTRDYICKNKDCITHKDKTKAEATFFRTKKSFQLTYVCTVCKTSWLMN